ncbi:13372_t:CDS:10, partial [Acaulospora colombiana]
PKTATSAHSHHRKVTSLDRLQANLRSPRTPPPEYPVDAQDDAVQMRLLGNDYRDDKTPKPLSKKDKKAMALLIVLWRTSKLTIIFFTSQLVFKYVYSWLHLPIIIPIFAQAFLESYRRFTLLLAYRTTKVMDCAHAIYYWDDVMMEKVCLVDVATDHSLYLDIAVDGWALTLLSDDAKAYASTAQTIGLNTGYFASYTVFLAFNSETFSIVSSILEPVSPDDPDLRLVAVYKNIQKIFLVHFVAKIGYMGHEVVTSLKLVEKGLPKEDLAVAVLVDFPFQIIAGWLAGKWSRGEKPLRPWLTAYWFRIMFAFIGMAMILRTKLAKGLSNSWEYRLSTPGSLIQLSMLNTASNLGGTWPGFFVLKGVDFFSISHCEAKDEASKLLVKATECVSEVGKKTCKKAGGTCVIERDGYYVVSLICIAVGLTLWIAFVRPTAMKLQGLLHI